LIDQSTYDFIKAVVYATSRFPVVGFIDVVTADIVDGSLTLDPESITTFPNTIEEQVFSFVNCGTYARDYDKTVNIKTTVTFAADVTQKKTSTSEYKIGINLGEKAVKFNAEVMSRDVYELTTSTSKSESKVITIEEKIKEEIPPKTALFMKARITKGSIRGVARGTVTYNAGVEYICQIGPVKQRVRAEVTNPQYFNTEPKYRTTDIEVTMYAESFERHDVIFTDRAITDDHPICKIAEFDFEPAALLHVSAPTPPPLIYAVEGIVSLQGVADGQASISVGSINTVDDGQFEIEFNIETGDCESSACSHFECTLIEEGYDGESLSESVAFAGWSSGESGSSSFTITRSGSLSGRRIIEISNIEQADYLCFDENPTRDQ
jgi:hypothetical protein